LQLVKSVATLCVGLALSSLIDSSVTGVVCFTCLWKCGLCPQAAKISLLELIRSCELDVDCLRVAIFSSAHRAQFLAVKALTALIGLPCQMMLQVIPSPWLTGEGFVSQNWVAKCLAHASNFLSSLTSFWTSLKCCCILALNFCSVLPMCTFPVLLHLTLWTAAHVVVATGTISSSSAVAGWRFKVLGGQTDCEFPGPISLKDFSKVGDSVVRRRHSQPLEVESVFDCFT